MGCKVTYKGKVYDKDRIDANIANFFKSRTPALLNQAKTAALNDMAPTMAGVFAEDIEAGLKEAAQQLNASESEAKTARQFYGDRVSDIALKLFPKETVESAQERKDIVTSGRTLVETVNPVLERMSNADYINEDELNAAADQIYSLLDRTEKSTYTPEQQASISNLFEPIISKIEGYEFRTKTQTSTVTEKVPVQVASKTERAKKPIAPALEQLQGSQATLVRPNGTNIQGTLSLEDGNYVLYNTEGEKIASLGEKAINDRDIALPTAEEMENPIGMDENGSVTSITLKTRNGDLLTINNPERALDLAIQLSSNIIDETPLEQFDTIYEEIQREIQQEVLVNEDKAVPKEKISSPPKITTNENEKNNDGKSRQKTGKTSESKGSQDGDKGQNEVLTESGAETPETKAPASKPAPKKEPQIKSAVEPKQKIAFDDKSILARMMKSKEVSETAKDKFKESGLKYKVQGQAEARSAANGIIDEFGIEESLVLAESGKFHGDVNSMIFAVSLDRIYAQEQSASTAEEKQQFAEQWADIGLRYQDAAESGGRFISAINDFYKKSPAGLVIKIEKEFNRKQDQYFQGREASTREAFDELINTVEGLEILEEEIAKRVPKKQIFNKDTEKKVKDFFAKLRIDTRGTAGSYLVPPQIFNAAIDVIEQSVLGGIAIGKAIERGINYINDNHTETWKIDEFKKDIRAGFKAQNVKRTITETEKEKILKKWNKKLNGLSVDQRNKLLSKSFVELIENGALEYDDFKKMYAEAVGLPQMTPELSAKLGELAKAINTPDTLKDDLVKNPNAEKIKAYQKAVDNAENASKQLNELIAKQRWWLDTFLSVMRLNTLGIVSLAGNIMYNIASLPVRFSVNATATGLDYLLSGVQITADKIFKTQFYDGRTPYNVFRLQRAYGRGFVIGGVKGIEQFISGVSNRDYFQKEVQQNLRPLQATKRLWSAITGQQKISMNDALSSFIEAFPTMGWSANFIARALNVGDKPFRFASEFAKAEQLANAKGLKGIDKEVFMLFPDDDSAKIIQKHGEEITFQQKNVITKALDSAGNAITASIKDKGLLPQFFYGVAKTLGYGFQPFLNTPLNVFNEFIHYAFPPLSVFQAGRAFVNKDAEKGINYLSKAAIGYSLQVAATQLIINGLLVPASDDDETAKERKGITTYQRQGQINKTGLKRLLSGQDATPQDDDVYIDLKYYGFIGMILLAKASQYKENTREEVQLQNGVINILGQFMPAVQTGLTDGVFSGTNTLLSALSMGGGYTDQWVLGMTNTFQNSFDPSWLRSFSLSDDKYLRDIKDMTLPETVANQFKQRWWGGGKLPTKVNIWGDKVESVPNNQNPYLYYMLGLNKPSILDNGKFGFAIYDYYLQTKDANIFPPILKREIKGDKLDPHQFEQLQILVGSHRKQLVSAMIESGEFEELRGEGVLVSKLQKVYKQGRDLGLAEFSSLYPAIQTPKVKNE